MLQLQMQFLPLELTWKQAYPLENCNIAIENGPVETMSFPIKHGDFLELCSIARESVYLKMADHINPACFSEADQYLSYIKNAQVHVSCPCKADLHCGPWSVWGTFWILGSKESRTRGATVNDSVQLVYTL